MTAERLRQIATSFEEKHRNEMATVNAGSSRHLSVRLGEHFLATKIDTSELVTKWARRGEEPVGRSEFRQGVQSLLDTSRKTNAREIDALFDELDTERCDTLGVQGLKQAFRQFYDAARKAEEEHAKARANAERFWRRADAATRAIEITVAYEQEQDVVDGCHYSLRERLELKLARKGAKANELVTDFGDLRGQPHR